MKTILILRLAVLSILIATLPSVHGQENKELPFALPEIRISLPSGDYVVEWMTPQELEPFWKPFEALLETGTLDELAWVLPYVRHVLNLCKSIPELQPYSDWMNSQLDYLEFASLIVSLHPPDQPLPPPPPPPRSPASLQLPSLPSLPPLSPETQRKRQLDSQSPLLWKQTLQKHPIPPHAIRLIPLLKQIFREEGVPTELVWLAEVESSFNPRARSPAGAVGLFQFMPPAAERFGLRLAPRDERESPTLSARAAARYLRFLHRRFGDWSLALAAYNAGEGRVGRTMERMRAFSFEAIAPGLPTETQLYVPRVFALLELREGITPSDLPPPSA